MSEQPERIFEFVIDEVPTEPFGDGTVEGEPVNFMLSDKGAKLRVAVIIMSFHPATEGEDDPLLITGRVVRRIGYYLDRSPELRAFFELREPRFYGCFSPKSKDGWIRTGPAA